MRGAMIIFRRELKSYFNTPVAYIFVAIFVGLMSFFFFFLTPFFAIGRADMRGFFGLMPFALFMFVPAVTMRLWSEELRVGTAELLLTLPFRVHEIVLGKFLAAFSVVALSLFFTFGIALGVGWLGEPDWGPIVGGYLGSLLLAALFVAMGAFLSSLTSNQVVALLVGLVAGIALVLGFSAHTTAFLGAEDPALARFIENVGVVAHFEGIERGILALSDVCYFLGVTVLFFFLNVFSIQSKRY